MKHAGEQSRHQEIGDTDMLQSMHQNAICHARKGLDEFDITYSTWITCFLKMDFDTLYGLCRNASWELIFGSFVTHHLGCFVDFSIGSLTIFLFMGTAAPETEKERLEH